ncbi:MAG TPA: hypothetical protein VM598_13865 [Bdellovibrionota bacterium]|nr:hypothetical protein [Bdellovibrionota bacterium]
MRRLTVALAGLILLSSTPAMAKGVLGELFSGVFEGRGSFSLGIWNGSFGQRDTRGHEASVPLLPSLGLQLTAGFRAGVLFLEYNVSWFLPQYLFGNWAEAESSNPTHRDALYYSYIGGNFGFRFPHFPIEPYLGLEDGHFGLSAGSRTDFQGMVAKAGVNVRLVEGFAIRGEYRRHFISTDDSGGFPDGISTQGNYWYLSFVGGKL